MDRSGIDFALVINVVESPTTREGLEEGRAAFEASRGRLIPVATIDPTRGEEYTRRALTEIEREPTLGGIKLFPGYLPFYPNDPGLSPIYELAHRRQVPVLIHQGDTLGGRGLLKFARPLEVDEVAGRFRDVRFVLCHLGNPWIEEATELVYKHPNVYTDTSGLLAAPSSSYFDRSIVRCRDRILDAVIGSGTPERFLFGSDWPLEDPRVAAQMIEQLDLSEEHRRAILGGNAQKLFCIRFPA